MSHEHTQREHAPLPPRALGRAAAVVTVPFVINGMEFQAPLSPISRHARPTERTQEVQIWLTAFLSARQGWAFRKSVLSAGRESGYGQGSLKSAFIQGRYFAPVYIGREVAWCLLDADAVDAAWWQAYRQ